MFSFWRCLRWVVYFVVCLELIFWLGGWITRSMQWRDNATKIAHQDVYRIMCIGESTTILGGKDSYPAQLETILNAGRHGRYQVINQGVAGISTAVMVRHLPEWIKMYRPNMVIAMIGANDSPRDEAPGLLPFLKKIKTVALILSLKEHIAAKISGFAAYWHKKQAPTPEPVVPETEYEQAMMALNSGPEEQKKLYLLINLARADGRDDIAERLYEEFLIRNEHPVLKAWVMKSYGAFLLKNRSYEKFVGVMENIPPDSWTMDLVKGYCHGERNMELFKNIVERMVSGGRSQQTFGYVASCYEEGGRNDLRDVYLKKLSQTPSSYASPVTRKNYIAIKDMLLAQGIQPVFIQYPMRELRPLVSIFEGSPDKDRIIFVDNGPIFQKAVAQDSYNDYFVDRAGGDYGHATARGNRLLAENVANAIAGKH